MLPRYFFQGSLRSNKSFRHATPLPLLRLSSLVLTDQAKKRCAWLELALGNCLTLFTTCRSFFHDVPCIPSIASPLLF
jgi:hypothetical protein